jgi:hypothetical protein
MKGDAELEAIAAEIAARSGVETTVAAEGLTYPLGPG